MIATHSIKHNGVWYKVGEEIKEDMFNKEKIGVSLTKTDINRMSTSELQSFATTQEIENAQEITGEKLKKLLIEKLGL